MKCMFSEEGPGIVFDTGTFCARIYEMEHTLAILDNAALIKENIR